MHTRVRDYGRKGGFYWFGALGRRHESSRHVSSDFIAAQVFSKPSRARQADVLHQPMFGRMSLQGLFDFGHRGAFEHARGLAKSSTLEVQALLGDSRMWKLKGHSGEEGRGGGQGSRSNRDVKVLRLLCHRIHIHIPLYHTDPYGH